MPDGEEEGKTKNRGENWKAQKKTTEHNKNNLGKRKSSKEIIYIYTGEKERKLIEEMWDIYIQKWKTTLYQKQKRILKQKWYGTKKQKGLKKEIIEEELRLGEKSLMMRMPQMTPEDLIRIVGN